MPLSGHSKNDLRRVSYLSISLTQIPTMLAFVFPSTMRLMVSDKLLHKDIST